MYEPLGVDTLQIIIFITNPSHFFPLLVSKTRHREELEAILYYHFMALFSTAHFATKILEWEHGYAKKIKVLIEEACV